MVLHHDATTIMIHTYWLPLYRYVGDVKLRSPLQSVRRRSDLCWCVGPDLLLWQIVHTLCSGDQDWHHSTGLTFLSHSEVEIWGISMSDVWALRLDVDIRVSPTAGFVSICTVDGVLYETHQRLLADMVEKCDQIVCLNVKFVLLLVEISDNFLHLAFSC